MLYIDMSYPCCCIMLHLDTTQYCNYVVICCMYIYIYIHDRGSYYPDILELDKKRWKKDPVIFTNHEFLVYVCSCQVFVAVAQMMHRSSGEKARGSLKILQGGETKANGGQDNEASGRKNELSIVPICFECCYHDYYIIITVTLCCTWNVYGHIIYIIYVYILDSQTPLHILQKSIQWKGWSTKNLQLGKFLNDVCEVKSTGVPKVKLVNDRAFLELDVFDSCVSPCLSTAGFI